MCVRARTRTHITCLRVNRARRRPCGPGFRHGDDHHRADPRPTAGSKADAKVAGKVRMEGKDYVMADGDVVEFRFNV
ncbi:DUF933 domain-containing protein [Lentzea sp. NPDC051838]|uniref:DUF933 domain-containing protein n=1 Tax=Lentzea sp. NPDC051838 TaxID=3154849 RepID=UPI0034301443